MATFDLKKVRVPTARDRVNKEDCAFCFKNIESDTGLFVDLNSFIGVCVDHLPLHFERTSNSVYLNIHRTRTLKPVEHKEGDAPKRKAVVLGIGMDGGFDPEDEKRWEIKDSYQLVSFPSKHTNPYPDPNLPWIVNQAVETVIKADTASKKDEVKAMELTEKAQPSKYTKDLKQLDNGVKIPRHGWKCKNCDLTENLWMNMTDGAILCGRRNFDGSGGNNHAVEHYEHTGYPLAVKLGTITPQGTADVYSYPEDIMVDDPLIRQHLAHFGINMMEMEKTDKTLAEMNVDLNNNYEWSRMQEAGKKLTPLFGAGYTGMKNIGNSCYLASVSQVLFSLPAFQQRYFANAAQIFRQAPQDPTQDFTTQMAKLAEGLLSGRFSVPSKITTEGEAPHQDGLAPKMFKSVVGANHPEFQTNRQQDALEFYQHMLTLVERAERNSPADPSRVLRLRIEERVECAVTHKVRYGSRLDNSISLPIPTERASNAAEYSAYEADLKARRERGEKIDPRAPGVVRPIVSLQACLEAWAAQELVHGFYSSATKARGDAIKSSRIATFPDVLCIHMRKFVLDGWVPRKLDALVDAPETLDLSAFRAKGQQPGEELLPEDKGPSNAAALAPARVTPSEALVALVVDMGFPRNRAEKAVMATNNAGGEEAMNWLLQHMDDPDIDAPIAKPAAQAAVPAAEALNEEGIAMLVSMGFTRDQAAKALRATGNNVERATDWIFSHADELNSMDTTPVDKGPAAAPAAAPVSDVTDGAPTYRLAAFVSHMGSNTSSGHYVCHIRKDGRWVAFDDQKVGASELLPKDLAYLYFYIRA